MLSGAAAEITAMATIGAADAFGLPVSTTHVLSSGVAGDHGREPFRPAVVHRAQPLDGLGAHLARLDRPCIVSILGLSPLGWLRSDQTRCGEQFPGTAIASSPI